MDKLNEANVLTNIRLSQAQKYVLSKLKLPDTTPHLSYGQLSAGRNIVANRDILVKLGMVVVGDNTATITDKGTDALRNEALIDDTGALTKLGKQYAYAENLNDLSSFTNDTTNAPEPSEKIPASDPPGAGAVPSASIAKQSDGEVKPSFEAWQMIYDSNLLISKD